MVIKKSFYSTMQKKFNTMRKSNKLTKNNRFLTCNETLYHKYCDKLKIVFI